MSEGLGPGARVALRFAIDRVAGSGGMGTVFRALDEVTGEWVALKVMHKLGSAEREEQRFLREAHVLAELRHEGIVSYVAHGHTERGQPYLAMQWLDGEDLSERLRRDGLRLVESLEVCRQVAAALTVAHRRGIVHRDLKPSNLFLHNGAIDRIRLLDFGVARRTFGRTLAVGIGQMTQTGMVVGTPEYMAPEQARGQRDIAPSADIFSLGCVLFECLVGRPPFFGEHIAAVLAKILFEGAPRLRSLRPEMPIAIEDLLVQMLEKDPVRRPRDAQALLAKLEALGELFDVSPPSRDQVVVTESLQSGEQQLVSVFYAAEPGPVTEEPTLDPLQDQARQARFSAVRTALLLHGVRAELLADGSVVATVTTSDAQSAATDQAAQAAHGALVLHEQWPTARVAICTGRGVLRAELPIGEAIDRAVWLAGGPHTTGSGGNVQILLDSVTAGLLDARFDVAPLGPGSFALLGEHANLDVTRPLLGKPTPCVGREQELAMLAAVLTGCIDDATARAVLVLAPSGIGKSRLRHEFVRISQQRDQPLGLLFGRAEPSTSSAPYALIGQALRRFLNLDELREPQMQRERLRERLSELLSVDDGEINRLTQLLAETISLPLTDEPHPQILAARLEPARLAELISDALCTYLEAEAAVQPLLMVLEDLQWADSPSLRLSETLLRALAEQPVLFFGLARPELEERFPRLWQERGRQEIRLPPLSRRASERLVQRVLGPKVPSTTVARIVDQSGGNALFLEELIRAVGEGKGDELPETVLAMLQARIGRLDAAARRVLRAASVYGESFSTAGVRALLGQETHTAIVESCLQTLTEAEMLESSRQNRDLPPEERLYAFRHGLLREAAYGLLTDSDRLLGHRLAATFLVQQGIGDPLRIADHYERAGDREQALDYFLRAAQLAGTRSDQATVEACIARAEACSPTGEMLGRLYLQRAQLKMVRTDLSAAVSESLLALPLLPSGGEAWCHAVAIHVLSAALSGQFGSLEPLVDEFARVTPSPASRGDYVVASGLIALIYTFLGMRDAALATLERAKLLGGDILEKDPLAEAYFFRGLATVHLYLGDEPWEARQLMARSVAAAERIRSPRTIIRDGLDLALHDALLGNHHEAESRLRQLHSQAQALGETFLLQGAEIQLAALLLMTDEPEKIEEARQRTIALKPQLGENIFLRGLQMSTLGHILLRIGQTERAIAELSQAAELMILAPGVRPIPLAFLLLALVANQDLEGAKRVAAEAEDLLGMIGTAGSYDIVLRLSIVEALLFVGEHERALVILRDAHERLLRLAAGLPDEPARQRFLRRSVYHARLLNLARIWLG